MNKLFNNRHFKLKAFTLIEMLVVVSIVVLLLAFSTPALMRTLQSSRLSSVGDTLFGAISEAQQIAFSQNVPVELRFFKFIETGETTAAFRSYQMFKVTLLTEGTGAGMTVKESLIPVSNLVRLPEGVVLVSDTDLSPLFATDGLSDTKSGASVGYSGVSGATYNAIRFMTDGSCRTVGKSANNFAVLTYEILTKSFFTLTGDGGQAITVKTLPPNFYTIQIDPFTGKSRSYRPGF